MRCDHCVRLAAVMIDGNGRLACQSRWAVDVSRMCPATDREKVIERRRVSDPRDASQAADPYCLRADSPFSLQAKKQSSIGGTDRRPPGRTLMRG